ncbi:MAG TPA: ATP-binding protein [Gemmatimonadaceae bacterium]
MRRGVLLRGCEHRIFGLRTSSRVPCSTGAEHIPLASEERLPDSIPPVEVRDLPAAPASGEASDTRSLPEAVFPEIIAISADAVVCVDHSQRIVLFNRGAERIFGYTAAEVMGELLEVLIPDRARAVHREHIARFGESPLAARRVGERGEIMGRRKNGEVFPAEASISKLDVGGRRIFTAVLRDISSRLRAEAELASLIEREHAARDAAEASERRAAFLADASALLDRSLDYNTTLQSLADLVVPKLADVCFIDVIESGSARRVASAATSPALGRTARELHQFPRLSNEPYLTRDAIESGRPVLVREATRNALERVTQHPEHLRLLLALHPRSYMTAPLLARGRTLGAMAFIASGDSRKYTSANLAFAEELARRAALAVDNARLYGAAQRATSARDEILGIVSHDLRNPLSAISMCASALEDSLAPAQDSVRYMVRTIQESSEWMSRLIQDLLDIASIETGHLSMDRRPEPVAALLEQLEMIFAAGASEAGIRLVLSVSPGLPSILADRERILQVLANIVSNALRFTPAGGEIHVRADTDTSDPALVRFTVSDTGCGIQPENIPHIFDRFWQARRRSKEHGTGLGLAISKGIVDAHGGRIWVESQVGVGSTLSFVIPSSSSAPST